MIVKNSPERNLGVVIPPQQAHLDKPTTGSKTTNVAGEVGPADKVDDQIDPARRRRINNFRLEIHSPVIKNSIGAQRKHVFDVACRSGGQHRLLLPLSRAGRLLIRYRLQQHG